MSTEQNHIGEAQNTTPIAPQYKEGNRIYWAITQISKHIGAIGKNKKNQQQGYSFRGIDDVLNTLDAALTEYEIIVLPTILKRDYTERMTKAGGASHHTVLTIEFKFMTSDGSFITCTTQGEAMDSGDKATNKCMSFALKYALLIVFHIPTQELIDGDHHTPPETYASNYKPPVTNNQTTKKPQAPPQTPPPAKVQEVPSDAKPKVAYIGDLSKFEANEIMLATDKENKYNGTVFLKKIVKPAADGKEAHLYYVKLAHEQYVKYIDQFGQTLIGKGITIPELPEFQK